MNKLKLTYTISPTSYGTFNLDVYDEGGRYIYNERTDTIEALTNDILYIEKHHKGAKSGPDVRSSRLEDLDYKWCHKVGYHQ